MPRSCPCRTCERKEGAKEERIRRSVYMFLVNKFLLGGTVHTLPIARRFFSRNFKNKSNWTRWLFLLSQTDVKPKLKAVWRVLAFQRFRSEILVSLLFFDGYLFSRASHWLWVFLPFSPVAPFSHLPVVAFFPVFFGPGSRLIYPFAMSFAIF